METGSLLKARCTGCRRNQDAEELVLTVLSLATCIRYKNRQWVNRTELYPASSSAAHHAWGLFLGDGMKGELCGSDAEGGDGKKKIAFLRQRGTRQYRLL